ncbi:triose-phosphate isomerase [Methylobacterium sp. BTF04]|uniref:triose-phosphate isomerase n=1 Tax=Methylobacterium sp. BTF04 TaxID=2708300 RepID=UPI0013D46AA6|nr:triose-phosphate isomerase [Methylobacterium sp. BTF04]NEU14604.1 triose-phosphate isomerase [Methylobacterium sp. BTF04]
MRITMRPLIAGNWKMHGVGSRLNQIEDIAASVGASRPEADVLLCVPATLIFRAARAAAGQIAIGGEDCAMEAEGAFTGDVSADMLKDAGASAVIVGHSERREHHGETDAVVAAKARSALRSGLLAIVCIGESEAQRRDGKTMVVCGEQLAGSLPEIPDGGELAVAYEPLWAIGSGHIPTAADVIAVHAHARSCLVLRFGDEGRAMRILYGGSVKAENAQSILDLADVGGVLIGGASLSAADFDAVLRAVPR